MSDRPFRTGRSPAALKAAIAREVSEATAQARDAERRAVATAATYTLPTHASRQLRELADRIEADAPCLGDGIARHQGYVRELDEVRASVAHALAKLRTVRAAADGILPHTAAVLTTVIDLLADQAGEVDE